MITDTSAVVFTEPGGPEVLQLRDLPLPEPGPQEARVRIVGAAVHPTDLVLRAGLRPLPPASLHVPGMAFSGFVSAAGEGSAWRSGDVVVGMALPTGAHGGAYRASIVAPDDTLARLGPGIDPYDAATLPMNGHTALQALRLIDASVGETVVVTGAAGALASILIPLAVSRGLKVIAVARPEDEMLVLERGASAFVAAGLGLDDRVRTIAGGTVDAVIDLAVLDAQVLPLVREGGVVATLRGWRGDDLAAGVRIAPVAVPHEWHHGAQLEELTAARYLTRPVRRIAPADAAQAHLQLGERGLRASLVLDFS